jgi:ABC-type amino acid transport substrate-binding protein
MRFLVLLSLLLAFLPASSSAEPLKIGIKESPPFTMKLKDGSWDGLSVELIHKLSEQVGFTFVFEEYEATYELIEALSAKKIDMSVAGITISAERDVQVDFSTPYYSTGYGAMVIPQGREVLKEVMKIVCMVYIYIACIALLFWAVERKRNPDIGERFYPGIFHSIYFIGYTAPTVGFGDITRTPLGKFIVIGTILVSLVLCSLMTAHLTEVINDSRTDVRIQSLSDFKDYKVGTVRHLTPGKYLDNRGYSPRSEFESLEGAIAALKRGEIDIIFHDWPSLKHLEAQPHNSKVHVLPAMFGQFFYGIALPADGERENLNRAIEKIVESPWWEKRISMFIKG